MSAPSLPYVDFSQVGPQLGADFPDVVLPDQNGREVNLHAARGRRRAMIVFYRSAGW